MTATPETNDTTRRPGKESEPSALSAPLLMFMTALDTTWRAFVPVLAGTFAGIGIDHWLNVAPIATIICLLLGVLISGLLIAQQLRNVRRTK